MFFIIIVTRSSGGVELYICKASNVKEAYRMTGVENITGVHTCISPEQFEALKDVDAGYYKKLL